MPSMLRLPSGFLYLLSSASALLYAPSTSAPTYWFELTTWMPVCAFIASRNPSSRLAVLSCPSA